MLADLKYNFKSARNDLFYPNIYYEVELGVEKPIYFLHIPKTAGTTLKHYLDSFYEPFKIFPCELWTYLIKVWPVKNMDKYGLFRGHFGFLFFKYLPQDTRVVAMVRDPVERAISQFHHLHTICRNPRIDSWVSADFISPTMKLKDLVFDDKKSVFFTNTQVRYLGSDINASLLRKKYLKNVTRRRPRFFIDNEDIFLRASLEAGFLEKAKNNLKQFACFGIQEMFQESLFLISFKLNLKPMINKKKLMTRAGKPSRSDFDRVVLKRLEKLNERDIELYKFAKRIFVGRYKRMVEELKTRFYRKSYSGLSEFEMINKMLLARYYSLKWGKSYLRLRKLFSFW